MNPDSDASRYGDQLGGPPSETLPVTAAIAVDPVGGQIPSRASVFLSASPRNRRSEFTAASAGVERDPGVSGHSGRFVVSASVSRLAQPPHREVRAPTHEWVVATDSTHQQCWPHAHPPSLLLCRQA